ncbi:universal stress protein [Reichenbachiella agarivorans]|uniref:Universal stress protein n=1 Tax=Reichenbachiella agarivorans TaxID=2979464 RepID=A0ABY6CLN8_9BACT|nr:universal stress protein [Reichenbachiella agarivorans]UXP31426.1 universal stress protein [Reichenbachiella agarivorans]
MKTHKILVPMDFSKCAINALRIAKTIAKRNHFTIEMVTAIHLSHIHHETAGMDAIMQSLLVEKYQQIDRSYKELYEKESLNEVNFEIKKFVSSVQDAIFSSIEAGDVQLVITGTKAHHDLLEKLLGSKSADMISFSTVPVLVIPENVTDFNIQKIGLAIDFDDMIDLNKLSMVHWFASQYKALVEIFYISENSEEKFLFDDQKVNLAAYFKNVKHSFINISKKLDSSGVEITEAVKNLGIDLLFMHPKNHKLLESFFKPSITKSVLSKLEIPMLSVHE